jgi:hypothetical protein
VNAVENCRVLVVSVRLSHKCFHPAVYLSRRTVVSIARLGSSPCTVDRQQPTSAHLCHSISPTRSPFITYLLSPVQQQQQQRYATKRLTRSAIAVTLRLLLVQSHQPTDLQLAFVDNSALLADLGFSFLLGCCQNPTKPEGVENAVRV